MTTKRQKPNKQVDEFRKLARDLGTDESEDRFFEALRQVAKADPKAAKIIGKLPDKKKGN